MDGLFNSKNLQGLATEESWAGTEKVYVVRRK
jgi:hypothetical protein